MVYYVNVMLFYCFSLIFLVHFYPFSSEWLFACVCQVDDEIYNFFFQLGFDNRVMSPSLRNLVCLKVF